MANNKIYREGIGNIELEYNYRLKRIRLQITRDGSIKVEVPKSMSFAIAEEFLDRNLDWVKSKLSQWKQGKAGSSSSESASSRLIYRDGVGEITLRKNARSSKITLRVSSEGEVRVSMPQSATYAQAEQFIDQKLEWIKQSVKNQVTHNPQKTIFTEETEFTTRFHTLSIRKIPGRSIKAYVHDKKINVQYPMTMNVEDEQVQDHIRHAITEVLRFEAKQYLPKVIHTWSEKLNLPFRKLTIKNNKTNWGSCSGAKNINLNLHLMRLPEHLIDLVVVHELIHTTIPNHGPDFKAAMRKVFPKADEWDRELNGYNTTL